MYDRIPDILLIVIKHFWKTFFLFLFTFLNIKLKTFWENGGAIQSTEIVLNQRRKAVTWDKEEIIRGPSINMEEMQWESPQVIMLMIKTIDLARKV